MKLNCVTDYYHVAWEHWTIMSTSWKKIILASVATDVYVDFMWLSHTIFSKKYVRSVEWDTNVRINDFECYVIWFYRKVWENVNPRISKIVIIFLSTNNWVYFYIALTWYLTLYNGVVSWCPKFKEFYTSTARIETEKLMVLLIRQPEKRSSLFVFCSSNLLFFWT